MDTGTGLIGPAELAEMLGVNERHVKRLVAERRIPFVRWGRLLRFDPVEVRTWIAANTIGPGRTA